MPVADPEVVLREYLAAMVYDLGLEVSAMASRLRVSADWTTPQALQWISRLRHFFTPQLAHELEQQVLRPSHAELITEGKQELYTRHHFSGQTQLDWGSLGPAFLGTGALGGENQDSGPCFAGVMQGSSMVEPPWQSYAGPSPFNLAWGIHDGVEPHGVRVVFAGSNLTPRQQRIGVRRQLLHWLNVKKGWGIQEGLSPADTMRALREANKPPFVSVFGHRASGFAFGGVGARAVHEHYERIVAGFYERICERWTR